MDEQEAHCRNEDKSDMCCIFERPMSHVLLRVILRVSSLTERLSIFPYVGEIVTFSRVIFKKKYFFLNKRTIKQADKEGKSSFFDFFIVFE